MEEIKETVLTGYPNIIPFDCTQKIIDQMKKDICKIKIGEEQGTGIFCKIPFPNKDNMLPVLITNNHVINADVLFKENEKFEIKIKEEKNGKEINLNNRNKYTNKDYDITIIEIKEKDEIKINDIINNNDENVDYIDETLYIIQYPEGQLSVSYGILQNIFVDKKYNFNHKCCTRRGSSGSPILNLKNKIIGIHKEGTNKYNKGTFLNYPIKEFIKQNYTNESKNKLKNDNDNFPELFSELEKGLMLECKLDQDLFYSKANKINWGNGGKRGGFEYNPPHGWIGIGLKVLGKYDNGNDDWLGNDGNKNEWAVAYRIVSGEYIKNILSDGFLVGMMNFFQDYDDIYHPGKKVGRGVEFFHNPKQIDELFSFMKSRYEININEKKYISALMIRVKPDKIRCPNGGEEVKESWILNSSDDEIRPYRILLKERKNII